MALDNRIVVTTDDATLELSTQNAFTVGSTGSASDPDKNGEITSVTKDETDATRFIMGYQADSAGPVTMKLEKDGYSFIPPQRTMTVRNNINCSLIKDTEHEIPEYLLLDFSEAHPFTQSQFEGDDPSQYPLICIDGTSQGTETTGMVVQSYTVVDDYEIRINLSTVPQRGGKIHVEFRDTTNNYIPDIPQVDIPQMVTHVDTISVSSLLELSNIIAVEFNRNVKANDATGFTLYESDGVTVYDTVTLDNPSATPSSQVLNLKLDNKVIVRGENYILHYNGSGTVYDGNNAHPNNFQQRITNSSSYLPRVLSNASILSSAPDVLVLTFTGLVKTLANITSHVSISGISETITGLTDGDPQQEGNTISFQLSGSVSKNDEDIKVSFDSYAFKDSIFDQDVSATSNFAVNNFSELTGLEVNTITINADGELSVIFSSNFDCMDGGIEKVWAGWIVMEEGQDITSLLSISRGQDQATVVFNGVSFLAGRTVTVEYVQSDGFIVNSDTSEPLTNFGPRTAINNSSKSSNFANHNSPISLATSYLGHEPTSALEVEQVLHAVQQDCQLGLSYHFCIGDYIRLKSWNIPSYDTARAFSFTDASVCQSPDNTVHITDFVIRAIDWYNAINGNGNQNNLLFTTRLSIEIEDGQFCRYNGADNTNVGGYKASKYRQDYILGVVDQSLVDAGVTHEVRGTVKRNIANGGSGATAADVIEDILMVPTEYEMFGAYTYSSRTYETDQDHISFFDSNAKRIFPRITGYTGGGRDPWLASPYKDNATDFCGLNGHDGGIPHYLNATNTNRGLFICFLIS